MTEPDAMTADDLHDIARRTIGTGYGPVGYNFAIAILAARDAQWRAVRAQDAERALADVIERTAEVIERQLALIRERATGRYLDKQPVVLSLTMHSVRLRKALAAHREARKDPT